MLQKLYLYKNQVSAVLIKSSLACLCCSPSKPQKFALQSQNSSPSANQKATPLPCYINALIILLQGFACFRAGFLIDPRGEAVPESSASHESNFSLLYCRSTIELLQKYGIVPTPHMYMLPEQDYLIARLQLSNAQSVCSLNLCEAKHAHLYLRSAIWSQPKHRADCGLMSVLVRAWANIDPKR